MPDAEEHAAMYEDRITILIKAQKEATDAESKSYIDNQLRIFTAIHDDLLSRICPPPTPLEKLKRSLPWTSEYIDEKY
jgi:hypothetical protein